MMSAAALMLLLVPHLIARLFTPDAEIIAAGVILLRVAAFFQLFDGFQVVATGALRGAGDTRTPMVCHFVGVLGDRAAARVAAMFSLWTGRAGVVDGAVDGADPDRNRAGVFLASSGASRFRPRDL